MRHVLTHVADTPYKFYLLIDEYDNFVNEVMVRDTATYRALFDADGPFKELMKSVKSGTEGRGIERVFVTGVSPFESQARHYQDSRAGFPGERL